MAVIINPGTGPVASATLANAWININAFANELWLQYNGQESIRIRQWGDSDGDDGRFSFRLYFESKSISVDMPGLPLDQTRFVEDEGQNIWHFPRLYIDGSSWIWSIGLDVARGVFLDEYEEDEV